MIWKNNVSVDTFGTHESNEIRFERKINIFAFSIQDFKEPFTIVFIYLARNVRLGALEREDEPTRVLFGAIVFNSEYQNVELKVENNSKGHLLNKNK